MATWLGRVGASLHSNTLGRFVMAVAWPTWLALLVSCLLGTFGAVVANTPPLPVAHRRYIHTSQLVATHHVLGLLVCPAPCYTCSATYASAHCVAWFVGSGRIATHQHLAMIRSVCGCTPAGWVPSHQHLVIMRCADMAHTFGDTPPATHQFLRHALHTNTLDGVACDQ